LEIGISNAILAPPSPASHRQNHPWETPTGLARGAGDGDWHRLHSATEPTPEKPRFQPLNECKATHPWNRAQVRLARKTICFSKYIEMQDTVIDLFINRYEFGRAV
jgi:hypothetical protein